MIIFCIFPKSGSSILHCSFVKSLNHKSVFEPFAYMPEKLTDTNNFNFVIKWIKGAPEVKNLDQYKIKKFSNNISPGKSIFLRRIKSLHS